MAMSPIDLTFFFRPNLGSGKWARKTPKVIGLVLFSLWQKKKNSKKKFFFSKKISKIFFEKQKKSKNFFSNFFSKRKNQKNFIKFFLWYVESKRVTKTTPRRQFFHFFINSFQFKNNFDNFCDYMAKQTLMCIICYF